MAIVYGKSLENSLVNLFDLGNAMLNCGHGANLLAGHAHNIAWGVFGNGIKRRGKAGILRANRNTCAAFNAGVPINCE
jgi:hypothetical protein